MDEGSPRRELNGQFGWKTCPELVKILVLKLVDTYRNILGDNLTGVYLHGSLAMGCFNPSRSDIDILAVTAEPLSVETKRGIIDFLLGIRNEAPPKGIETSIVLEKYFTRFVYPTPYELHYSPDWDKRYRDGEVDFSEERSDEDLAAHAVITRERGICLFGKPISEVFGEVPEECYRQSLLSDARWILSRLNEEDSVYIVLNFCHILAFFKDGLVTSKKEGGQWGIDNLPGRYRLLISQAMDVYAGARIKENMNNIPLNGIIRYVKRELGIE